MQSVFAVDVYGYAVSDLQEFPPQLMMKVLNRLFRSPKKACQPKAKAVATSAVPPKSLGPKPSEVKTVSANPKSNAKAGLKACKSKRKGKPKTAEAKANTLC